MADSDTSTRAAGRDATHITRGRLPGRRGLLAGAVGLVGGAIGTAAGAGGVATPGHGQAGAAVLDRDGELIRLCEAFMETNRQLLALWKPYYDHAGDRPAWVEAEECRLVDLQNSLAEAIVWAPANTTDEIRAKAAVLATYLGEHPVGEPEADDPAERIAWSLTRDLLRVA